VEALQRFHCHEQDLSAGFDWVIEYLNAPRKVAGTDDTSYVCDSEQ